jgi:hypothetical protein
MKAVSAARLKEVMDRYGTESVNLGELLQILSHKPQIFHLPDDLLTTHIPAVSNKTVPSFRYRRYVLFTSARSADNAIIRDSINWL